MSRRFSIASVTVAYNGAEVLGRHLESLRNQNRKLDEIVIVNNASTDHTAGVLATKHPDVTVLTLSENGGVGGGLAAGLEYAAIEKKHDWVWIFDQDSLPAPDALECLLSALTQIDKAEEGTAAILAPVCVNPETGIQYPPLSWRGRYYVPSFGEAGEAIKFVDMVISSGSLMRRQAIEKVGLPRADFFMDFVDFEHCLRLRRHGFCIAIVRDSIINHAIGSPTTLKLFGRTKQWTDHVPWREYYMARNETFTMWEYSPKLATKTYVLYRLLHHSMGILLFGQKKLACLRMIWRGFLDGRAGRLGIRFLPDKISESWRGQQTFVRDRTMNKVTAEIVKNPPRLQCGISVAMCTYNGRHFLPLQLQSIAAQRRLPDELVICDDGSTDGSDQIAAEFAQSARFPVRLMKNDIQMGSTRNFDQAISSCQQDVVVLADQDDVWYPDKLRRIEEAFGGATRPIAVFSDADLIDASGRNLGSRLWASFSFGNREQKRFSDGEALDILIKHPVVTGATMAFRREFRDLLLPIPSNHVHDNWISFLLAACGTFLPISEPLMQYRRHGNQQIGPGSATLRERVARALSTGPDFYFDEIERFRQLYERLESWRARSPYAERALREIRSKISHRNHRAQLPRAGVTRIPRVIREMLNGGYWRYSEGWESVAKDMAGVFGTTERSGGHSPSVMKHL
jgi:GT2 family glycosyltransferase